MQDDADIRKLQTRIDLLGRFISTLKEWETGELPPRSAKLAKVQRTSAELESWVNRNALAARQAIQEAGLGTVVRMAPPAAIGGMIVNLDVVTEVFREHFGRGFVDDAIRLAEQAMGFYEHLRDGTGLVRIPEIPEGLDVVAAIERALGPAFKSGAPSCEREVQDQIEVILQALGVEFSREQEVAPVAARASKPDFVFSSLGIALEVKFANEKHTEGEVQEEIMADVAAYKTKWKRAVFVVYDKGAIHDPAKMRADNMKYFGVSVLIVKH